MSRLIDTHSHIFVEEFADDLERVVQSALDVGVDTFVMPCIRLESLPDLLRVRERYPEHCYATIGLHPTELKEDFRTELDRMKAVLDRDRSEGVMLFHGIGEVGLDLYWEQDSLEMQLEAFERQIEWALEYGLPLLIHSRSAFEPLCRTMDKYRNTGLKGVFHCFSDGPDEALRLMEYEGFMFGIGGVSTFRKSPVPQALEVIPHDRVVLETDCPYLSPVPYRGRRNEPAFMVETARRVAQAWNCTFDEVAGVTVANACKLFRIQ